MCIKLNTVHAQVLVRQFGDETLCLQLPQGACAQARDTAAIILDAHLAGLTAAEIASVLTESQQIPRAQALTDVESTLRVLLGGRPALRAKQTAFLSPGWDAPPFQPPTLPSLPGWRAWLISVAATGCGHRAQEAAEEWRSSGRHGGGQGSGRLLSMAQANLDSHGSNICLPGSGSNAQTCWIRTETMLDGVRGLLFGLADAGIPAVLHKGASAALLDYCDTSLRPMGDLDLLIPFPERTRAMNLVLAHGFEPLSPQPDPQFARFTHSGHYFRQQDCLRLDLHWFALWSNCWDTADERLWATARKNVLHGAPYFAAEPAVRLVVLCIHGLRLGVYTRHDWVGDAAMLLARHGASLDWDRLCGESRARKVSQTMHAALSYLSTRMGAPVPAEVLKDLRRAHTTLLETARFKRKQYGPVLPEPGIRSTFLIVADTYTSCTKDFRLQNVKDFLHYYSRLDRHASVLLWLLKKVLRHAWADISRRIRR